MRSVCLWSTLHDRRAKQVLENFSLSGCRKFTKAASSARGLKNDKKFVYELNWGKFFTKLSLRLFFAQKQIKSATCRSLPLVIHFFPAQRLQRAAGMQKFGPINQITGKKMPWTCGFSLFCIHTSDVRKFFFYLSGHWHPLERREPYAIVPASWRVGVRIPPHTYTKLTGNGKGARRRIISQTLTKMWPCGLSLRLHEFSIPSLPNWHPGVKKVLRPPSPGTIDGLIRAALLLAWYSLPMIYETVIKSERRHKGTKYDK